MKKVGLWVMMFFIGVIAIPLTWMVQDQVPFNSAINAFFNTSNATLAFYFLQWIILIIVTEIMIFSFDCLDYQVIKYTIIILLGAFVTTKFYLYYLILAILLGISYAMISSKKNKLKDDLTSIIEDVKEEFTHQQAD